MADKLDAPRIRESQREVQSDLVGKNGIGSAGLEDIRRLNEQQQNTANRALQGFPDAGSLLGDLSKEPTKDGVNQDGGKQDDGGDKAQPNTENNTAPQEAPQSSDTKKSGGAGA